MTKTTYLEATAFGRRIEEFKKQVYPGMHFTVYVFTGDQKIDRQPRDAVVVAKYMNWLLLKDEKGIMYGPTYHKLFAWGNT